MNRDEREKIKRLLETEAAASDATDASHDDGADRSEWMDQLEDRVEEFVHRMNQLKERIGSMDDPADQLEDYMNRLEKRARRLDRTAKRLLGEKVRSRDETSDE